MELETITLSIANGQTVSDVADLTEKELVGIIFPPAWDGGTFQTVSFETSLDGSTWYPFNNLESEPTTAGGTFLYDNRRVQFRGAVNSLSFVSVGINWKYAQWLKVIAPVAQTADRDIVLIVKERGCSINLEC